MSERVVLITGSNLGNREQNLAGVCKELENEVGKSIAVSSVYESAPWGEMSDGGGAFLNQVLVLDTELAPLELLDTTQEIERRLGRGQKGSRRGQRTYVSRTIDIDILYYGNRLVASERLIIPHPQIADREFVLIPLAEAVADLKHPVTGRTAGEMLAELRRKGCGDR